MNDAMPPINLLPIPRRIRRARRRAVSRWSVACAVVGVVSMAPAASLAFAGPRGGDDVADRIARAQRGLDQLRAEEPALRQRVATLTQTETVLKVVEDRPDWRPFLHALADLADGARFERVEFRVGREAEPEIRMTAVALVESQTQARALVLRLEDAGIFKSVRLHASTGVTLANADVVRCEIHGSMPIAGGGQ